MDSSKPQPQPRSGPVPSSLNGVFFEDHSVQHERSITLSEEPCNHDDIESLRRYISKGSEDNEPAILGPTAMKIVDEMDK